MIISTKDNMDAYKPVPVVIIPLVRFIGGPTSQGRTRSIQGSGDPEISIALITTVGIPVEDDFDDIGTKTINLVIHMECDGVAS